MSIDTGGWHTLRCEKCGRKERKEVVYGLPDAELMERGARGEVVLAGCCVGEPLRPWWCEACEPTLEERERAGIRDAE